MSVKNKFSVVTLAALVFGFVFFAENSWAAVAGLSWNANSEADLAGYKIYYGTSPRTGTKPSDANQGGYSNVVDAHNVTSYTINDISNTGTTYFSVIAYDTSQNESVFSTEVHKIPGDMDKDGVVNMSDFNVLAVNFGNTSPNCLQTKSYNDADADLSCVVDMNDFNALAINFGYSL